MQKPIDVPKGSDVVGVSVTGHTFVRLLDARGDETFRSESPAEQVTAVVKPGTYTVDTDGKLGKIETAALEPRLRGPIPADATKPPPPRK
jgi:hypothetical protein